MERRVPFATMIRNWCAISNYVLTDVAAAVQCSGSKRQQNVVVFHPAPFVALICRGKTSKLFYCSQHFEGQIWFLPWEQMMEMDNKINCCFDAGRIIHLKNLARNLKTI